MKKTLLSLALISTFWSNANAQNSCPQISNCRLDNQSILHFSVAKETNVRAYRIEELNPETGEFEAITQVKPHSSGSMMPPAYSVRVSGKTASALRVIQVGMDDRWVIGPEVLLKKERRSLAKK